MTFGERIKELRASHRMSQKKLAAEIGINRRIISAMETGVQEGTHINIARRIAVAFGVDMNTLFDGVDYPIF